MLLLCQKAGSDMDGVSCALHGTRTGIAYVLDADERRLPTGFAILAMK